MSPAKTKIRSLRADLLIAAVLPLALFTVGTAATVYYTSRIQREARVFSQLDTVAAFLIDASELGVLAQAPDLLREPVLRALAHDDVVHVSVYNASGDLIVKEGMNVGADLPYAELRVTDSAPDFQALSANLYELRRVIRYRVDYEGPELLGFFDDTAGAEYAPLGKPQGYIRVVLSSERLAAEYHDLLTRSGAAMALVLVLAVGLALALARRPLRGMTLLNAAAREVGLGRLDVEVPELGSRETAELAAAFNEMSAQLREARKQIAEHQASLERKVAERTAQLNSMRIEAERASRAKSHFLANMSHEIRTPMTAILGYTDAILENPQLSDDQRDTLQIVKRNGDHLLSIINGILDLSRIEAGQLNVEQLSTDLVQLVRELAATMQIRAEERRIGLDVEFISPLPTCVLSDPVRIRQAIINLVENAIKFTEEGSVTIQVSYDSATEMGRIDIIDTGIGISEEVLPTLFEEFEQADTSTSRRFGGTGLGLSITKHLAELLGGDCTIVSKVGVGTKATLTFAAPPARGSMIRPVSKEAAPRPAQPLSEPAREEPLEAHILLAEDGADNQRLISRILRKAGATVEIAENGRIAVDRLQAESTFDLVLMDMAMPEMDGYAATRTLRDMGYRIPIVALTAHALEGERDKCIAAGCDDYLTKPVQKSTLLREVRKALEAARKVGA